MELNFVLSLSLPNLPTPSLKRIVRFKIKRTKGNYSTNYTYTIRDNRVRIEFRSKEEVATGGGDRFGWKRVLQMDESFRCPREMVHDSLSLFFFFQASVFVRNRRHLLPTNRILFQPLRDIISINVTRIYSYQISLKKKRGRKIVKRSDVIRQFN